MWLRSPIPGELTLRLQGPDAGGASIDATITRGTPSTTTSDTFVDAGCTTAALANSVQYLVLGLANARVEGASNEYVELEFRHGSTRLGVSRWVHDFENFNLGDSAAGMVCNVAAVVTGDGTSTLNMRFRGETAGYPTIRVGSQVWQTISLANLVANTDYWSADSASGDTAEFTTSADTEARARLVLVDSGTIVLAPGESQFLTRVSGPSSTQLGPTFQSLDVRTLVASTSYTIRWEFDSSSSWNAGDTDGQVTFTPTETGDYLIIGTCEAIGTGTAFSFRRTRVFVLRLSALSSSSWISNAGGLNYTDGGAGSTQECTNGVTGTFAGEDVVVLGYASIHGENNWVSGSLRQQGSPDVDTPSPDGYYWNNSNDYVGVTWVDTVAAINGSVTWNLLGQADSGGTVRIGRNLANSADSRAILVALGMQTAGGGGSPLTATPTSQRLRTFAGTQTSSLGGVLNTPASQRARFQTGAATQVLGNVVNVPAGQRLRVQDTVHVSVLGGVSDTPVSLRIRVQSPALTTPLGGVSALPASERLRVQTPAQSVLFGDVLSAPASQRVRVQETAPSVDSALSASPASVQARLQGPTPTSSFGGVSSTPISGRLLTQAPAANPTIGAVSTILVGQRIRLQESALTSIVGSVDNAATGQRIRFQSSGIVFGLVGLPSAQAIQVSTGSHVSLRGSVDFSPVSSHVQVAHGVPTASVAGLSITLASQRLRIRDATLSASLGVLTAALAVDQIRLRTSVASTSLASVYTPEVGRLRFVESATSLDFGSLAYAPASQQLRLFTGVITGNFLILGKLRVSVREDQLFGCSSDDSRVFDCSAQEAQRFGLEVNDVD